MNKREPSRQSSSRSSRTGQTAITWSLGSRLGVVRDGESDGVEATIAAEVGTVMKVAVSMMAEAVSRHKGGIFTNSTRLNTICSSRGIFRSNNSRSRSSSSCHSGITNTNLYSIRSPGDDDHKSAKDTVNSGMSLHAVPLECLHFIIPPTPRIHMQTTLSLGNTPQRSEADLPFTIATSPRVT